MQKLRIMIVIAVGTAALLSGAFVAGAAGEKITICHFTGSETNPFEVITVSENGWLHGHSNHAGDVVAEGGECNVK